MFLNILTLSNFIVLNLESQTHTHKFPTTTKTVSVLKYFSTRVLWANTLDYSHYSIVYCIQCRVYCGQWNQLIVSFKNSFLSRFQNAKTIGNQFDWPVLFYLLPFRFVFKSYLNILLFFFFWKKKLYPLDSVNFEYNKL